MPVAAWMTYVVVHFVVVPAWFTWRYQRSPYALRWLPRNRYDLVESAYGLLVTGNTVALLLGPPEQPRWPAAALASLTLGSGLILWAVAALGSNWRIGQDEGDPTCVYTAHGPYRLLRHPIYTGMVISAFGQMFLTSGDMLGLTLFLGTLMYVLLQSRAESRRWSTSKEKKR